MKKNNNTTKSPKRAFVTGATGFLGKHLIKMLIDSGWKVRALVRSTSSDLTKMGVEVIEGDLDKNEIIENSLKDCTHVFHLAGKVSRKETDREELFHIHLQGTKNILQAVAKVDKQIKVIYASTSGTVACTLHPDESINEQSQYADQVVEDWSYYTSKIEAEKWALAFAKENGLHFISINPSLLLGPGDDRLSSSKDVLNFLQNKVPLYPSGGVNFVDVRDVAKVILTAAEKAPAGERYLIGAHNWDFKKFFQKLADLSGKSAPLAAAPNALLSPLSQIVEKLTSPFGIENSLDPASVAMAQCYWYFSNQKARNELKFNPRDPNSTLFDTIEDLRRKKLW